MASNLLEHLAVRRIAKIVDESSEKDDEIALRVMCVLDHSLEKYQLYGDIMKTPKLFTQLLAFKSYANLYYWKYAVPSGFSGDYILMCQICKLQGPYHLILAHMAATHNAHNGAKVCLWCKRTNIKKHIVDGTLKQCYDNYLEREYIEDTSYPQVIVTFYEMILELCKELGVLSVRTDHYTGKGIKKKAMFDFSSAVDDIESVFVFKNYHKKSNLNKDKLNRLFVKAIHDFYGEQAGRKYTSGVIQRGDSDSNRRFSVHDTPPPPPPKIQLPETNEETGFITAIASILSNVSDGNLKKRAKLEIQRVALEYSNKAFENELL